MKLKFQGPGWPPTHLKSEQDPNGKGQHEPGAKMDSGKVKAGILGDFSLALMEVAKVCTYGAKKYTRHGWEEVPNGVERYHDAKWRHKLACKYNRFDDESGLLHLAHEAWNTLAELELMLRGELEG